MEKFNTFLHILKRLELISEATDNAIKWSTLHSFMERISETLNKKSK
jgi:hypothetical protein